MRCWRCGLSFRTIRNGRHGALRIQQMIFARPQAQADQSTRIGNGLALPSVIGLVATHRFFAGRVPRPGGRTTQVVFADQSFLNRVCAFGIDLLLATDSRLPARPLSRCLARSILDARRTAGGLVRGGGTGFLRGGGFIVRCAAGILSGTGRHREGATQCQRADRAHVYSPNCHATPDHTANLRTAKEKPSRPGTVIISDLLRQYQFRLGD